MLDSSAWKRLKYHHFWILAAFITGGTGYAAFCNLENRQEEFVTMFFMFLVLTIALFLHIILGADKYYRIKLKTTKCYIYVYGKKGYGSSSHDIIFIQDGTEARVQTAVTSLHEDGFQSPNWEKLNAFLYCPNGDNNKWYYLSSVSDEPQFLGKKLVADEYGTIFLSGITEDGKQNLHVLHRNGIRHITADSVVIGNAYVPREAEKNTCYVGTKTRKPGEIPENYLIVKNDGKYQVYGVFNWWADYPQCWQIDVPAIIFQEVKDRVVLVNEGGEYRELCRKIPATRWINDVIPELTKDYDDRGAIGGIVWQFDEKTNSLTKLYEGYFRALGFSDGSIIGDDWEYSPDYDDGVEYEYEVKNK